LSSRIFLGNSGQPATRPTKSPWLSALGISAAAWSGMEWEAIPIVADILGVRDVERLIYQMTIIRDHQRPT